MSDTLLLALVDRALSGSGAFQVAQDGVRATLGPSPQGGFVLEVGRTSGRLVEREAVDIAVQVHRLLERKGIVLAPEMLAYRGSDRARCFVLASPEAATA